MKRVVLVVEDEPVIRLSLVKLLENSGFETLEAEDGATALKVLAGCVPHVVLLDLMLPDISGLDVLRHIRQKAIPTRAVVVTALPPFADAVEACAPLKPDAILHKPVLFDRLIAECQYRPTPATANTPAPAAPAPPSSA